MLAAILAGSPALAGAQEAPASAPLQLVFRDEEDGGGVTPRLVLLDGHDVSHQLRGNTLATTTSQGIHQVTVIGDGYFLLEASAVAAPGETTPCVLSLEAEQKKEAVPENGAAAADRWTVSGVVAEKESGGAVGKAEVRSPELGGRVLTDGQGRFTLSARVERTDDGTTPTRTGRVVVSRSGYLTEERSDLELVAGRPLQLRIALEKAPVRGSRASGEEGAKPIVAMDWSYEIGHE